MNPVTPQPPSSADFLLVRLLLGISPLDFSMFCKSISLLVCMGDLVLGVLFIKFFIDW
jgi:hypothetical protein